MRVRARHSGGLCLRPYRFGDWKAWRASFEERESQAGVPKSLDRVSFRDRVARHRAGMSQDLYYALGLFHEDGPYLGGVDIYVLARLDLQIANLGYWIHPQHHRCGYATEAVGLAAQIAFGDLRLHRLEAAILPDNRASLGVARAAGMHREGLRRSWTWDEGGWRDHVVFALVDESGAPPKVRPTLASMMRSVR